MQKPPLNYNIDAVPLTLFQCFWLNSYNLTIALPISKDLHSPCKSPANFSWFGRLISMLEMSVVDNFLLYNSLLILWRLMPIL